jgi:ABC-type multidrug transport system permease subunit
MVSLLSIYDSAASIAAEKELGIQMRINTTPLKSSEYIFAQMISYTIKPLIQFTLGFGIGYAVGFRPTIGIGSYLLVILFLVILTFCSVGFGLITASFSKNASAAGGLSFIFIVPQQVLTTFIPASFMGAQGFAWIFPSYFATTGIGELFAGLISSNPGPILIRLVILMVYSAIVYCIGLILYESKKRQ